MENTLEQTTQTLHLAIDVEVPTQTQFNPQSIEKAIKLLLQNHVVAFSSDSPKQILKNLGFQNVAHSLPPQANASSSNKLNKWEKMLQRFQNVAMTPAEREKFDKARQEFRENFIMRDITTD